MYKDLCNEFKQKPKRQIPSCFRRPMKSGHALFGQMAGRKRDSVGYSISIRMQKECPEFKQLLDRINPMDSEEIRFLTNLRKA